MLSVIQHECVELSRKGEGEEEEEGGNSCCFKACFKASLQSLLATPEAGRGPAVGSPPPPLGQPPAMQPALLFACPPLLPHFHNSALSPSQPATLIWMTSQPGPLLPRAPSPGLHRCPCKQPHAKCQLRQPLQNVGSSIQDVERGCVTKRTTAAMNNPRRLASVSPAAGGSLSTSAESRSAHNVRQSCTEPCSAQQAKWAQNGCRPQCPPRDRQP